MSIAVTCKDCGLELPSIPDFYEHCISSHNNTVEEASEKIESIKNEFYAVPGSETESEASFWSGGGSKEKEIQESFNCSNLPSKMGKCYTSVCISSI